MTHYYPVLGSASDQLNQISHPANNQKHHPDLGSDASSVWNFSAHFSEVIWQGNQWQHHQMSAVFSSYCRSHSITINYLVISDVVLNLAQANRFRYHLIVIWVILVKEHGRIDKSPPMFHFQRLVSNSYRQATYKNTTEKHQTCAEGSSTNIAERYLPFSSYKDLKGFFINCHLHCSSGMSVRAGGSPGSYKHDPQLLS